MCTPAHALKSTSNQSFAYFFILQTPDIYKDFLRSIFVISLKKFSSENVLFYFFSKTISSIIFQICFQANHSQDPVFKISKIIQNFDYKYIS